MEEFKEQLLFLLSEFLILQRLLLQRLLQVILLLGQLAKKGAEVIGKYKIIF